MNQDEVQNAQLADLNARLEAMEAKETAVVEEATPPAPEKRACYTCNRVTICPTCKLPIGDDGHPEHGTVNYLPEEGSD